MPDDLRRAERLEQAPREDIAMGHRMQRYVEALQDSICRALERYEPEHRFREDPWAYAHGEGGGRTRVLEGGAVFEKAGVNTSAIAGAMPEGASAVAGSAGRRFFATGLSLVLHARSPYVPTVHANFRYFAVGDDLLHPDDQWFGGGADLTPVYPFLEDAQHFHAVWKRVCDDHPAADYDAFKARCDAYFYLPHRGETRGVGGLFFDHLRERPEETFHFVRQAGRAFLPAYLPIVDRRREHPYGEAEVYHQELRRGRYAEFNLLWDRGTRFGIESGGRTESILMSLPPRARWAYDARPAPGTAEAQALWFFQAREWLNLGSADVPDL